MWKINKKGRSYLSGKALSSVIYKIVQRGGDTASGFFPGKYIDVANELSLHCSTVSKIRNQFCEKSL
jgi:hypothetical protein